MDRNLANKVFQAECKREQAHIDRRICEIAHKVPADEVGAEIICRNASYMSRSVGRVAQGAHATTYGLVLVDGVPVIRCAQKPTGKTRDHKAHKALRVEASKEMYAATVDRQRRFAYMTAPFRKGGVVYSKVSKRKRNRFRAILHKADGFLAAGEIAVALELARAL